MLKDNESVHNEQISPLMKQVIAICKEHGIPMHATFQCNDEGLLCTTHVPVEGQCKAITALYQVAYLGWMPVPVIV